MMNRNDFLNDLVNILKIDSVLEEFNPNSVYPFGKKCDKALKFMLKLGEENGFKVYNASNYAGHIEYGSGDEIIGILCHLDVVPAVGNWTNPPFEPAIKDNLIYARGAIDDKGPLMAAFYALKELKEENVKINKRVRLIFGLDEESGSRCIKKYLEECEMPNYAFSPDADFPLINGEKGIASFDIISKYENKDVLVFESGDRYNVVPDLAKVKLNKDLKKEFLEYLNKNNLKGNVIDDEYLIYGKSSHAMIPEKGINAISLMVDFLKDYVDDNFIKYLDRYLTNSIYGNKLNVEYENNKLGKLTINLANIRYSNNGLKIGLNIRYPEIDYDLEVLSALKKTSAPYELDVFIKDQAKPLYIPEDDILVKTLLKAYNDVTNENGKPFTIGGGTYSKSLNKCVAFGALMPGKEDMCHKVDEYANIDDLIKASKIYRKAIEGLGKL